MSDVQITMNERGARYGDFSDVADVAQGLQDVMRETEGWENCNAVQRQALTAIADKIGRILSGDPHYADNWHDIQGYARLVEERLTPSVSSRDEREFPLVDFVAPEFPQDRVSELLSKVNEDTQVISFSMVGRSIRQRMTWQDVSALSAVHPVYIRGVGPESVLWFRVLPGGGKTGGIFVQRHGVDFLVVETIKP